MKLLRNIFAILLIAGGMVSCTPEETADEEIGMHLDSSTFATGDDDGADPDNDKDEDGNGGG